MGRKRTFALLLVPVIAVVVAAFFYSKRAAARHVFINETSDHRFDDSIRVSILAAEKRTGVQNAVVITGRTDELDFARAAAETFQKLRLGRRTHGRAILYYFSPSSRTLKIEVGQALEGVLPDATVNGLELAAKSFIFVDKYQDFWAELINTLNIAIQQNETAAPAEKLSYDFSKFSFLSGGAGILSHSYSDTWDQLLKESRRSTPTMSQRLTPQASVADTVTLYIESLQHGFGDADLDLVTKESQFFRKITPRSSFQLYRNARMYAKAGIDRTIDTGDLAFVFFRPNSPVLPLVLKKADGVWRVHEPLSWSLFQRYEDSNAVFLKFPLTTDSKELNLYLREHLGGPLYELKAPLTLDFVAQTPDDTWRSDLIHLYWLDRAEQRVEKVSAAELSDDELMLSADIHMNLGHFKKFLSAYEILSKRRPNDTAIQKNVAFYRNTLNFEESEWVLTRP